jgi:hypothetical protein
MSADGRIGVRKAILPDEVLRRREPTQERTDRNACHSCGTSRIGNAQSNCVNPARNSSCESIGDIKTLLME